MTGNAKKKKKKNLHSIPKAIFLRWKANMEPEITGWQLTAVELFGKIVVPHKLNLVVIEIVFGH